MNGRELLGVHELVRLRRQLRLLAGDTVQFRLDSTQFFENTQGRPDLDIQGDSIGPRLNILAPTGGNPVPEPSTLSLLSLALGALFAGNRLVRRRQP